MALNVDGLTGEIVQNGLQRRGIPVENVAGVAANVGLIVVEVSVLDVRRQTLLNSDNRRWRRWRRWGWRRRGHVDRGRARDGPTRTGGGQGIGGGIARRHAIAAGALHGADALVDGYARDRAGDFPTQGGRLTALNRRGLRRELRHAGSGRRRSDFFNYRWRRSRWRRWRHLLLTSCREHRHCERQTDYRELPFTEHEHRLLNSLLSPHGPLILTECGQLLQLGSIGQHGVNLAGTAARFCESDVDAIRRPTGILVLAIAMRQLHVLLSCNVHGENVECAGCVSLGPCKGDALAVGVPRSIGRLAGTRRQPLQVGSIHTHPVNLLRTGAARRKHDIVPGLRIHFWLDFDGTGRRDRPKPRSV